MSTKKQSGYIPYIHRTSPDASPTTAPTEIRSDAGSRWMSPAPQPSTYSSWTPALAPIVGSPSIPPPGDFPDPDLEEDIEREQYEQNHAASSPSPRDVEQGYGGREVEGEAQYKPRSTTRGFVGGFMAELKKLPNFMVKNHPRGSGVGDGGGPSPRLSYYSSASPSVHGSPLPSQTTQSQFRPSTVPIEELYESEASDNASESQHPIYDHQPNEMYDGTSVHDSRVDPSVMSSPVQIGAEEITDYEKTQTPYPFTNPDDKTLPSYVDRLHRFFTDIYYLPWMSLQVSSEYIPADDSSRGRYRKGEPVSWYSSKHHKEKPEIDLIASPSPPPMIQMIPPTPTLSGIYSQYSRGTRSMDGRLTLTASQFTYAQTQRSHSRIPSESGTAFRELRSPGAATASAMTAVTSPGASSHGLGHHSMSESIHYASPSQNVRPYPSVTSAISSPQTRLGSEYYSPRY